MLMGLQHVEKLLTPTLESNPDCPDISVLICLLEIVLKNNTFEFDNKFYKQLQGTAMGTKLAPAYVNIFMGKLEQTILSHAPYKPLSTNAILTTYSYYGHTLNSN